MKTFPFLAVVTAAVCLETTGCTSLHFYADADRAPVAPEALRGVAAVPVRLDATFLINGERRPELDGALREQVVRVMEESRLFSVSDSPTTAEVLSVKVNDVVDKTPQPGPSFLVSGLTLGAKPVAKITDRYEFELRYRNAIGDERFAIDRDALWSTLGKVDPPTVRGPYYSPNAAFGVVMEDALLTFFKELAETRNTRGSLTFVPQQPQQLPTPGPVPPPR